MRLSFTWLASAAALVGVKAIGGVMPSEDPTVFNGVTVPPVLELGPSTFEAELKKHKYLVVKHYR